MFKHFTRSPPEGEITTASLRPLVTGQRGSPQHQVGLTWEAGEVQQGGNWGREGKDASPHSLLLTGSKLLRNLGEVPEGSTVAARIHSFQLNPV